MEAAIATATSNSVPKANIVFVNDLVNDGKLGFTFPMEARFSYIKIKGNSFIELVSAHELGHQLGISVTNADHHDKDPFPKDSAKKVWKGLMFWKIDNTTGWLRSDDWRKANQTAVSKP